jgi:hypothetical protein
MDAGIRHFARVRGVHKTLHLVTRGVANNRISHASNAVIMDAVIMDSEEKELLSKRQRI